MDDTEPRPTVAFLKFLRDNPQTHEALAVIVSPDDFTIALRDLAERHGYCFSGDQFRDLSRPDPLGLARFETPLLCGGTWPGHGWLPARSVEGADSLAFDWAYFGNGGLSAPFFEDSVRRATSLPFNRAMRLRLTLDEVIAGCPDAAEPPAGFIFHLSRCGSTLLARLLASYPGHARLPEPEPLDAAVRWAMRQPRTQNGEFDVRAVSALRAMVAALMRNLPVGTRAFFKLDCWHTPALPLFRAAFPDVPWLFLYRDPVEVAVSQLAMAGVHVVPGMPGADMLGLCASDYLSREDYCARVLGRICRAAVENWPLGGGMFVHYADIARQMRHDIPRHFGFIPDGGAQARLGALEEDNAKHPGTRFEADGARKQAEASPELKALVLEHVEPFYRRLEEIRRANV